MDAYIRLWDVRIGLFRILIGLGSSLMIYRIDS
jgi:hypothetical protein